MKTSPVLLTLNLEHSSGQEQIILSDVPAWELGNLHLDESTHTQDLPFHKELQFVVKAKTSSKILLALVGSPKQFLRRTFGGSLEVDYYSMPDQLQFEWKLLQTNINDKIVGKTFRLVQSNVPLADVHSCKEELVAV
ncbi:hypothetical protein [uncultured Microscilla sp.]|uniref:hypothetical protein n=1 Tax=uncultured Microscilla sp. TaxID=432653 RepID=UPI00261FD05F|nr:hypothetical protein [uncultured Microscilla sp.]